MPVHSADHVPFLPTPVGRVVLSVSVYLARGL